MRTNQTTTLAALFWDSEQHRAIPLDWFDRALALFRTHHLSPILFTASGGPFEIDDCYVLAEASGDLVLWGEVIPARRTDLVDALACR